MKPLRSAIGGAFSVVAAAVVGLGLLMLAPALASGYASVANVHPALGYVYVGVAVLVVLGLAFLAFRTWRAGARTRRLRHGGAPLTATQKQALIQEHIAEAQTAMHEASPEERAALERELAAFQAKLEAQRLEIVAFGTVNSGKSSILNALAGDPIFESSPRAGTTVTRKEVPWPRAERVVLVDTPGLGEVGDQDHAALARREAARADLVLFVVAGPLKDFEVAALAEVSQLGKPVVLCLNKTDWLTSTDRGLLLEQLREQARRWVDPSNIVSVQAETVNRTRIRVAADGREAEEEVAVPADISPLARRMLAIVDQDGHDLLLANLLLRSTALVGDALAAIQARLDARAHQTIARHMWEAGAVAALMPLPILDLAGSTAVTIKLILELARTYRQPIDLAAARKMVEQLGASMVGNLGATMAAPTVGALAASALKALPGVGTIAGGVLQGLVQALVTRWIGQVSAAYFKSQMRLSQGELEQLARQQWREITTPAEIALLLQEGARRLPGGGARRAEAEATAPSAAPTLGTEAPR